MLSLDRRKGDRRTIERQLPDTDQRSGKDRRSGVPRRKYERYKIKDYVFVEIKDRAVTIGQVLDISKAGLSFHYLDISRRLKMSFKIDIYVKNNGCRMDNVPFNCVTDLKADKEYFLSYMPIRRRGGRFKELSQNQICQLEDLIKHHTIDVV
jgi:hypothetical protein